MPRSSYDPRYTTYRDLPVVANVAGTEIHCDGEDGTFWAKVGQDVISRKGLADLKREIAKRTRVGVKVLRVSRGDSSWESLFARTVTIVSVDKRSTGGYGSYDTYRYRLENGGTEDAGGYPVAAYDAEKEARFADLTREYELAKRGFEAFEREWQGRWRDEASGLDYLTPQRIIEMQRDAKDENGDG
jgi:hypothetical protein